MGLPEMDRPIPVAVTDDTEEPMSSINSRRGLTVVALSTALATSLAATAVAQDEKVELTLLADNTEGTMAWTEALVDAYDEVNPNV